MSRCRACDCVLSEQELCIKWPDSNEYADMCMDCLDIALDPDSVDDYYENRGDECYEE
jgi:hypothetical protein